MKERKDDKRRVPTAQEVGERLASVKALAIVVTDEYTWLYRAAYERSVVEEVKVKTGGADPTAGIVSGRGKARARSACTDASEKVADALAALRHAENLLLAALDHQSPRERIEPVRYPVSVTREDLRLAHDAQDRRRDRGEAIP